MTSQTLGRHRAEDQQDREPVLGAAQASAGRHRADERAEHVHGAMLITPSNGGKMRVCQCGHSWWAAR